MKYLIIITLIIFSSILMNQVSAKLKFPSVVGQLVAGVILGPAVLHLVKFNTFINYFFNLGVIILMFITGLESNLKLLKKYLKPSLTVAFMGVLFPMIIMPIIGYFIRLSLAQMFFLGVTFSATSVSITVEVLKEMKQLCSREGTTILGASVADDVIAVVLLSLVSIVSHQNIGGSLIPSQDLGLLLTAQTVFFLIVYLLIRWIVPWLFKIFPLLSGKYSEVLMALVVCFGMSVLADTVGLSAITGSFFAGIAVGRTPCRKKAQAEVSSLGYLLFIPIFFISIGISMTLSGIVNHWCLLIILTIAAILTKLLGAGTGGLLSGFNKHSSLIIGSGMISRGEVALIIAQIGLTSHLISVNLYSTIISATIITTCLAPVLLRRVINN